MKFFIKEKQVIVETSPLIINDTVIEVNRAPAPELIFEIVDKIASFSSSYNECLKAFRLTSKKMNLLIEATAEGKLYREKINLEPGRVREFMADIKSQISQIDPKILVISNLALLLAGVGVGGGVGMYIMQNFNGLYGLLIGTALACYAVLHFINVVQTQML